VDSIWEFFKYIGCDEPMIAKTVPHMITSKTMQIDTALGCW
jgi:hypothetical protein